MHPRSGPHWLTQCLWDHQKGQHSGQALRVALVRTPRKGGPASGMKGMTAELGGRESPSSRCSRQGGLTTLAALLAKGPWCPGLWPQPCSQHAFL